MRRFLAFIVLLSLSLPAFARVNVRAHTTKRGKFVHAHQRTDPNRTQRDNWSSKPNVNPNTGKKGTKTPKR